MRVPVAVRAVRLWWKRRDLPRKRLRQRQPVRPPMLDDNDQLRPRLVLGDLMLERLPRAPDGRIPEFCEGCETVLCCHGHDLAEERARVGGIPEGHAHPRVDELREIVPTVLANASGDASGPFRTAGRVPRHAGRELPAVVFPGACFRPVTRLRRTQWRGSAGTPPITPQGSPPGGSPIANGVRFPLGTPALQHIRISLIGEGRGWRVTRCAGVPRPRAVPEGGIIQTRAGPMALNPTSRDAAARLLPGDPCSFFQLLHQDGV